MHLPFLLRDSYRRVLLFRPAAIAYLDDVWPDHHSRTYTHTHTHTNQMVKEEEERRMLLEPRWPLASIIPFDYFDSRPFFFRAFTLEDFFLFLFPGRSPVRSDGLLFYFFKKKIPATTLKPNEIRERERKERPTTTDNEIHHSQKT